MGNYEMDFFEGTQAEVRQSQVENLSRELKTSSLYLDLAFKSDDQGDTASAAQARVYAEVGYETVFRWLSDQQCVKHLSINEAQELTNELDAFRQRLDWLQGLSEVTDASWAWARETVKMRTI
jgi:hypothetical protein